jgi:hypothetical protein
MTLIGTTRFLVRLSEPQWLRQMKHAGRLRFTPLSHYRATELKNDAERFDEFKGALRIDQPRSVRRVTLEFRDKQTGAFLDRADHKLAGPIKWFGTSGITHVLCFSIHEQPLRLGTTTVDLTSSPENLGAAALLVHDFHGFVSQVKDFMMLNQVYFECAPVEYVPHDFDGEYGAFRKPDRLKHQREYRLGVGVQGDEPVEFTIPGLGETMEVFSGRKVDVTCSSS